jgi:tRNA pseudouridine38-40 synthase
MELNFPLAVWSYKSAPLSVYDYYISGSGEIAIGFYGIQIFPFLKHFVSCTIMCKKTASNAEEYGSHACMSLCIFIRKIFEFYTGDFIMKKNYKLTISYDGTRYYGWEHQPNKETIQGKLEHVIFRMCDEKVKMEELKLIGAGRTDAGVHARGMVANIVLDVNMTPDEIRDYMNHYLPDDIAVNDVREASPRFHARYNAVGKTYRYTCFAGPVKTIFDRKYVTPLDSMPDIDRMRKAAEYLQGQHDYASFCTNPKMKKSTVRIVDRIEITSKRGYLYFTFHGTGFLYNMVRVLVGTLLEVGNGKMEPEQVVAIMEAKDRRLAGPTAPAQGLCLMEVDY